MKVSIIQPPTGLLNGRPWPEAGEEIDLPQVVAEAMADAGHVKVVVEKRPAPKRGETRKA